MTIQQPIDRGTGPRLAVRVGGKMREIRKSKGMTLLDVARHCKTTPQTIQRLESANMTLSIEWIERICRALGAEPHALFADDETLLRTLALQQVRSEARLVRLGAMDFIERVDSFLEKSQ